jgi:predicted Zn-dependent protease
MEVMSRSSGALSSAVVLAVLLGASPLAGQQISNPKLYEKSLSAAREALEYYGEHDDAEARRRVNDVGYRLAVMSNLDAYPFTFYLVDMPEPNAFALPGGQIFVTRGMLGLGLTDDMLACLLGHELAHVTFQHGTRMQRKATLLNVLSTALLVGVMVGVDDEPSSNPSSPYGYGGDDRKGSLVQGTAAAGMALSELLLRNYSREFEDEADVEGQRLAAAAGFDPAGAHQLWTLMNARIPQAKVYGYWRTHPFSDQRLRAAEVRAAELKTLTGRPPEDYRAKVQQALLDYAAREKQEPELDLFVETSALHAWPRGARAESLRLAALHRRRDAEIEKPELQRDYGELLRIYEEELEEVRLLTPDSAFLATLEQELAAMRGEVDALYPKALEVWRGDVVQTPFLEVFLSNYPTSPEVPAVALALGNAYSRLGRQVDAVEQFLRASEAGPESEAGRRALEGLRNLTPHLEELAALQQLADDVGDPKLAELSRRRLAELAPKYEDIENGAGYLKRYPESEHGEVVRERLEALANNLYGEVVLYQEVGDHVKALERIQLILTHAPLSHAAEQLREQAVFES